MGPRSIVIARKLGKDSAQMRFPKHDHVVETVSSDRADQSLCMAVLPRRACRNWLIADAHAVEPALLLPLADVPTGQHAGPVITEESAPRTDAGSTRTAAMPGPLDGVGMSVVTAIIPSAPARLEE